MSILINIGISILSIVIVISSTIITYNMIMKRPIFSIPWSQNELQNQINQLSVSSDTDIKNIKNNIIPSIQKTLEKAIEDTKTLNLNSNKELQNQVDELNKLL